MGEPHTRWSAGKVVAGAAMVFLAFGAAARGEDGGYTKEQAARGAALFMTNCSQCHGRQLQGAEAPALAGRDVMGTWVTAQGIYDYFSVAMPPNAPGQLGEAVYLDILAHILAANGAAPGTKPLTLADLPNVDLMKVTAAAAAPAAVPAKAPAQAAPAKLPQAFTAGKSLPTVGQPGSAAPAPAAPAAPKLPQAFTAGRQLPTVALPAAPPPLPGPGAP